MPWPAPRPRPRQRLAACGKADGLRPRWRPVVRPLALAALLALAAAAWAPPVVGHHVPATATVVELPRQDGGPPEFLCVAQLFAKERVQVGEGCRFWCITDGGCAIFLKDFDYLEDLPFTMEFNHTAGHVERRHTGERGYVCVFYNEMADFHFTMYPDPLGAGVVGHAFGVKDEGQFCLW